MGFSAGRSTIRSRFLIVLLVGALVVRRCRSSGLLGVGIERFAYRPLRNAPRLAPLITAIGVSFILQNIGSSSHGLGDRPAPADLSAVTGTSSSAARRSSRPDRSSSSCSPLALMVGAAGVRQPDPARPGDALHGPGPRGRPADGRRHQPDDRAHLLPWRGARGRGRRGLGPLLRLRPASTWVQRRPQGVHRGRPRRHRQHQRARCSAASSSASSRYFASALGYSRWSRVRSCSRS